MKKWINFNPDDGCHYCGAPHTHEADLHLYPVGYVCQHCARVILAFILDLIDRGKLPLPNPSSLFNRG